MLNLASPRRAIFSGIAGFLAAFGVMALLPEDWLAPLAGRSEEHTSELQSL